MVKVSIFLIFRDQILLFEIKLHNVDFNVLMIVLRLGCNFPSSCTMSNKCFNCDITIIIKIIVIL